MVVRQEYHSHKHPSFCVHTSLQLYINKQKRVGFSKIRNISSARQATVYVSTTRTSGKPIGICSAGVAMALSDP